MRQVPWKADEFAASPKISGSCGLRNWAPPNGSTGPLAGLLPAPLTIALRKPQKCRCGGLGLAAIDAAATAIHSLSTAPVATHSCDGGSNDLIEDRASLSRAFRPAFRSFRCSPCSQCYDRSGRCGATRTGRHGISCDDFTRLV